MLGIVQLLFVMAGRGRGGISRAQTDEDGGGGKFCIKALEIGPSTFFCSGGKTKLRAVALTGKDRTDTFLKINAPNYC